MTWGQRVLYALADEDMALEPGDSGASDWLRANLIGIARQMDAEAREIRARAFEEAAEEAKRLMLESAQAGEISRALGLDGLAYLLLARAAEARAQPLSEPVAAEAPSPQSEGGQSEMAVSGALKGSERQEAEQTTCGIAVTDTLWLGIDGGRDG